MAPGVRRSLIFASSRGRSLVANAGSLGAGVELGEEGAFPEQAATTRQTNNDSAIAKRLLRWTCFALMRASPYYYGIAVLNAETCTVNRDTRL